MSGAMLWGTAHVVVLALLAWILREWAVARPDVRRRARAGAAAVVIAIAAAGVLFHWQDVPIGWITILQEGRTMRNVQQLYGMAPHAGTGFFVLVDALSGHDAATLPAIVEANVALWLVNAILFYLIADVVLGVWCAALLLALAYACNANSVHAALSETPAMLWATYFWLGCIAAAVIHDEAHTTASIRRMALLCVALLAVLTALLRTELLVVAAPAVAIELAAVLGWQAHAQRAAHAVLAGLRALIAAPLWVLAAVVAGLLLIDRLPWPLHARWLLAGLQPVNLSFLNMPRALGVFLPWGLIALFLLGVVHAVRRWFAFALLPFTLIILFKVYASAGHGAFFEMFRYLTYLTPIVFVLMLFGFRELGAWAQQWAWPWWWRRVALLVLVLTCAVWKPPGAMKEIFGRGQQLPGMTALPRPIAAVSVPLLAWNQQTEIRYLLDLISRYPGCVFITKATRTDAAADGAQVTYRWGAFGHALTSYRELPDDERTVEQVAAELAPNAACVLFYRGMDCNLTDSDGCRPEILGRPALEERVLENLPYNDIREYGAHRAEIHLGVYPIVSPRKP